MWNVMLLWLLLPSSPIGAHPAPFDVVVAGLVPVGETSGVVVVGTVGVEDGGGNQEYHVVNVEVVDGVVAHHGY